MRICWPDTDFPTRFRRRFWRMFPHNFKPATANRCRRCEKINYTKTVRPRRDERLTPERSGTNEQP